MADPAAQTREIGVCPWELLLFALCQTEGRTSQEQADFPLPEQVAVKPFYPNW